MAGGGVSASLLFLDRGLRDPGRPKSLKSRVECLLRLRPADTLFVLRARGCEGDNSGAPAGVIFEEGRPSYVRVFYAFFSVEHLGCDGYRDLRMPIYVQDRLGRNAVWGGGPGISRALHAAYPKCPPFFTHRYWSGVWAALCVTIGSDSPHNSRGYLAQPFSKSGGLAGVQLKRRTLSSNM